MKQRQLVEAFKTFFDKSVAPYLANNETAMNEWKTFNTIISSQPIDYSQLQLYTASNNRSPIKSNMQFSSKFGKKVGQSINSQKKNIQPLNPQKKNLISYFQNFQNMLVKNQQKLEQLNRKDQNLSNTVNNSNTRRYH